MKRNLPDSYRKSIERRAAETIQVEPVSTSDKTLKRVIECIERLRSGAKRVERKIKGSAVPGERIMIDDVQAWENLMSALMWPLDDRRL